MVNRREVDELKEFLSVTKTRKKEEEVSIVFDGKQYSVRIPKKFVDAIEINTKKDSFLFQLLLSSPASGKSPRLSGELIRS
jgi:hypothetical protein